MNIIRDGAGNFHFIQEEKEHVFEDINGHKAMSSSKKKRLKTMLGEDKWIGILVKGIGIPNVNKEKGWQFLTIKGDIYAYL
jgi:hypothetical protein